MNPDTYYARQSEARGLDSENRILAVLNQVAPIYARLLPRWLPQELGALIYEAACGPGIMLRWLRSVGYVSLAASDISGVEVALARAAGFDVREGSSVAELQTHATGSLDCVIGVDFIEHLPKDVLLDFLNETSRVLKPGGRLILRAPNGDSPFVGLNLFNDITHHWAYTTTALRALMKLAGFAHVEFVDDTLISIQHQRFWRVPLMYVTQVLLRTAIRLATREGIVCLGASYYVCARK